MVDHALDDLAQSDGDYGINYDELVRSLENFTTV